MTGNVPTQTVHPWKAAVRTFVQAEIPLLLALAVAAPTIIEELPAEYLPDGVYAWLILAATVVAGFAAALARIAAIPVVNEVLARYVGLGTGDEDIISISKDEDTKVREDPGR